jgi:protein SCO1/2
MGWTLVVLALIFVSLGSEFAMTFFGSHDRAPVVSSGEAKIGGPFALIGVDGRPVDQRLLDGKWSAVFFGYTNCPDTCPATLAALNAARLRLTAAQRASFQVVFISVDPGRDTPAQMKLYTSSQGYPPGALIGLTGSAAQVKAAADAYRAVYAKSGSGPDYAVQHSAAVYLMDPQGKFVRPLDEREPPQGLAADIQGAMRA